MLPSKVKEEQELASTESREPSEPMDTSNGGKTPSVSVAPGEKGTEEVTTESIPKAEHDTQGGSTDQSQEGKDASTEGEGSKKDLSPQTSGTAQKSSKKGECMV